MEFLSKNSIYIVFIITVVIWAGIFFLVNNMNRRIKSVESILKEGKNEE
jgi:low affinity Fe/Cu permease